MDHNIPKTERSYPKSIPIDQLSLSDGINLMINEQKKAALEVKKSIKILEKVIKEVSNHLNKYQDGRIIYVGAGTSGRIGVQDGVELYPTFNWPKNRVDFLIAGGENAILNAIENAEDDISNAKNIVNSKSISKKDVVIALAASGNTPFTCEVLKEANSKKALTIAISNNPHGKLLECSKYKIVLDTGEEIIAGSTRLKAGTSQKICLNILSSLVMTKIGRVKNGLMSCMVPMNKKLRKRKILIDYDN